MKQREDVINAARLVRHETRAQRVTPSLTRVRSTGRFIERRVGFINEFYLARLNLSAAALRNVETVASPVSPAVNAATVELKFAKAEVRSAPVRASYSSRNRARRARRTRRSE